MIHAMEEKTKRIVNIKHLINRIGEIIHSTEDIKDIKILWKEAGKEYKILLKVMKNVKE